MKVTVDPAVYEEVRRIGSDVARLHCGSPFIRQTGNANLEQVSLLLGQEAIAQLGGVVLPFRQRGVSS